MRSPTRERARVSEARPGMPGKGVLPAYCREFQVDSADS